VSRAAWSCAGRLDFVAKRRKKRVPYRAQLFEFALFVGVLSWAEASSMLTVTYSAWTGQYGASFLRISADGREGTALVGVSTYWYEKEHYSYSWRYGTGVALCDRQPS